MKEKHTTIIFPHQEDKKNTADQQKGILLARLLQKAVEKKRIASSTGQDVSQNSKGKPDSMKNNDSEQISIVEVKQHQKEYHKNKYPKSKPFFDPEGSENFKRRNMRFQEPENSSKPQQGNFLDEKGTPLEDSSLSIEPSILTLEGEQVSEVLRYIYIELFGENRYLHDKNKYAQLEGDKDLIRAQIPPQFNKEGKLLENIINEIKQLKEDVIAHKRHTVELGKQLQEAYIKVEQKEKQVLFLERQIVKMEKNYCSAGKKQIAQGNTLASQDFEVFELAIKQLQEQNLSLEQTIRNLQKQNKVISEKNQEQILGKKRQEEDLKEIELMLEKKQRQVENLVTVIGELEVELQNIKVELQSKEKYDRSSQFESPQKPTIAKSAEKPLSAIKQEDCQAQESPQKILFVKQAQAQTDKTDNLHGDQISKLEEIIKELKNQMFIKEGLLNEFEKKKVQHEEEVEKYEEFIQELSTEIQICQQKLKETHQPCINKKVQTEQRLLQITSEFRKNMSKKPQAQTCLTNNIQKETSIAQSIESIGRKNNKIQEANQLVMDRIKQNSLCEVSVGLSQFSESEELRDIRNLTQELSEAYDKIIALTYEVNYLKKKPFLFEAEGEIREDYAFTNNNSRTVQLR